MKDPREEDTVTKSPLTIQHINSLTDPSAPPTPVFINFILRGLSTESNLASGDMGAGPTMIGMERPELFDQGFSGGIIELAEMRITRSPLSE